MISSYARSLELKPSSALAYVCAGEGMALTGSSEAAIGYLENSMRLSPRAVWMFVAYNSMALAHFAEGRYAQAVEWARRSIQHRPDYPLGIARSP